MAAALSRPSHEGTASTIRGGCNRKIIPAPSGDAILPVIPPSHAANPERQAMTTKHRTSATRPYVRADDLPRLIPLWPAEIEDRSLAGHAALIQKLRKALREERRRGIAGHWCYDLTRHAGLLAAYRKEVADYEARLAQQRAGAPAPVATDTKGAPAPEIGAGPALNRAAFRGPSSWRAEIAPLRNSGLPSGNRGRGSTSCGIRPATSCNASAGAA